MALSFNDGVDVDGGKMLVDGKGQADDEQNP